MPLAFDSETVTVFLLILGRVGGLVAAAPFFSSLAVAYPVRVLLSVALAFSLLPLTKGLPVASLSGASLWVGLANEFLIGILLGMLGQLFLAVLQLSGQLMGFQIGFGVINVIDPQTQVETPVLSTFKGLLGILIFLLMNGHHWFLEALAASFEIAPPGRSHISPLVFSFFLDLSASIFVWGFQLAAPVILVLVVTDVLLGITGRAAPQIHVLIVGMPLKVLLGVFVLSASFTILVPGIRRLLEHFRVTLWKLLPLLG